MHIAVIDDGIDENLFDIGKLINNIEITADLEVQLRSFHDQSLPSHGTTCAAIIKKYAPDAVFSSVKILGENTKKGCMHQLIAALKWCIEKKICLVNLSLGTIDYRDFEELQRSVDQADKNGIILVAACNNRNVYSYPASLPNVIGVKCDISCSLEESEYVFNSFPPDGIDIIACGRHVLKRYDDLEESVGPYNSFAAPAITAVVHNILGVTPDLGLKDIKMKLKKYSSTKSVRCTNDRDTYLKQSEINVPLIAISGQIEDQVAVISSEVAGLFKRDGYNAVTTFQNATGVTEKIVSGLGNFYNLASTLLEKVKILYAVHNPDVILIAVHETQSLMQLKKHFEIDIQVVLDELPEDLKSIETEKVEGCMTIFLSEAIKASGIHNDQKLKEVIQVLYQQIIDAYTTREI